jgi:hypothetical protein
LEYGIVLILMIVTLLLLDGGWEVERGASSGCLEGIDDRRRMHWDM